MSVPVYVLVRVLVLVQVLVLVLVHVRVLVHSVRCLSSVMRRRRPHTLCGGTCSIQLIDYGLAPVEGKAIMVSPPHAATSVPQPFCSEQRLTTCYTSGVPLLCRTSAVLTPRGLGLKLIRADSNITYNVPIICPVRHEVTGTHEAKGTLSNGQISQATVR